MSPPSVRGVRFAAEVALGPRNTRYRMAWPLRLPPGTTPAPSRDIRGGLVSSRPTRHGRGRSTRCSGCRGKCFNYPDRGGSAEAVDEVVSREILDVAFDPDPDERLSDVRLISPTSGSNRYVALFRPKNLDAADCTRSSSHRRIVPAPYDQYSF